MPMKNPSHPGRLLKADLDELGLTVSEAAQGLGMTRQQLYRILNGQSAISPDTALKLEQAIGGTANGWLAMQMNYELARARLRRPASNLKKLRSKVA